MKSDEIETTVGQYLLMRLKEIGVDHVFGVPGDFVLGFLNQLIETDVKFIGTCNELNAAYAADGYARVHGIGAITTTFGVGELSAINGVAGAFAEGVPLVVITGAPAMINFRKKTLLHHTLGDYLIPMRMFQEITVATTELKSGLSAPGEIDRVLAACIRHKLPVYINLPSDVVKMKCKSPQKFDFPINAPSDPGALKEAVTEASEMLEKSKKPLILGDVELIRFKLQNQFEDLIEKTGYPYATMMLGKSILSEHNMQFIGTFEGDRSRPYVKSRVESADCILQLGALMTDFNTGGFTTNLSDLKTIRANSRSVKIRHHTYENVYLHDFIEELNKVLTQKEYKTLDIISAAEDCVHRPAVPYTYGVNRPITVVRFFDRMSHYLKENSIVIAETGVSLFSATEILLPQGATFIGQTFYGSIGYSLGATLGVSIAFPQRPVVLFVGDGSFQMTCQELSTMIRNKLKPVIFLLNNEGYTIERVISDKSYNDIQPWKYHRLVEIFGGGVGYVVKTEDELEDVLKISDNADTLVFIEVHTGKMDCSEALKTAGKMMAKINNLDN